MLVRTNDNGPIDFRAPIGERVKLMVFSSTALRSLRAIQPLIWRLTAKLSDHYPDIFYTLSFRGRCHTNYETCSITPSAVVFHIDEQDQWMVTRRTLRDILLQNVPYAQIPSAARFS